MELAWRVALARIRSENLATGPGSPAGAALASDPISMSDVSTSVKQGVGSGLLAGAMFAAAQIIGAVTAGDPAILALRRSASVLLGPAALTTIPTAVAIVVGLIAHAYLSTMYGLSYGVYNSALSAATRRSARRQAAIGALYGAVLWLVNLQVFARIVFPWLLAVPQLVQIFLHAACFGVPLGLLYAAAERDPAPAPPLPLAVALRWPPAAATAHPGHPRPGSRRAWHGRPAAPARGVSPANTRAPVVQPAGRAPRAHVEPTGPGTCDAVGAAGPGPATGCAARPAGGQPHGELRPCPKSGR